jgi:hypothetical protein
MDSQHGARNAITTRNKINTRSNSKQTGNQISLNNDINNNAHIESQNRIVHNISPRNDAMEIDLAIRDPVVDLERCRDDDIQSLLNNDTMGQLPITNRDNNINQTRVNMELHELLRRNEANLARLENECNHWRSLAQARQQAVLTDQNVNTQSSNIAETGEIISKRKKKRNHSSSSSSSCTSSASMSLSSSSAESSSPSSKKKKKKIKRSYLPLEKLKVLTFTGDLEKDGYDFKRWRKLTHDYLKNVNTSEKIKLQALNRAIAGNAGIMLSSNSYKSISQIFKALKAAYSHVSNTGKLFNIRQKDDETVGECYARILAEMRRSKNITSKGEEDIGMICLRTALRPEILEKLSNTKFQKLSIMLDVAKQFEADFLENKSKSKTTPTTKNPTKIGTALTLISEEMGLENAESVKKYVVNLKKSDSANQTSNINSYNNSSKSDNNFGSHEFRNNSNYRNEQSNNKNNSTYRSRGDRNSPGTTFNANNRSRYNQYQYQRPREQTANKFPYNCYHCKKPGHSFMDCRFASQVDKEKITSRLHPNNYTGHQQNINYQPQQQQSSLNESAMVEKPRQP